MGVWINEIKNHDIWASLQLLGASLDNFGKAKFNVSADTAEGIERLKQIVEFTEKRLAATDPFLLDVQNLDSIRTHIREIFTIFENFTKDEDESRILTANLIANNILAGLGRILPSLPVDDANVINESLTNYRNNISEYTRSHAEQSEFLNKRMDEIKASLLSQEQKLSDEQNRLASLSIEQQSQFSALQDARASEHSTIISDLNSQFSTLQLKNQGEVNELIKSTEKKLTLLHNRMLNQQDQASKSYDDDLGKMNVFYGNQAQKLLAEIDTHREDAENLLGVIGNVGATSGYLREANNARYSQYVWQFLTVLALGGLIWVAYLMAFPPELGILKEVIKNTAQGAVNKAAGTPVIASISHEFVFYQTLATRIFLSVTFGIFATYSARQAEKYMEMDKRNRKLALELTAVGPYIAPLPAEMQNKFRADLAEKSFGVIDHSYIRPKKDPVTLLDVLKSEEVEDFVARIIKKVKETVT